MLAAQLAQSDQSRCICTGHPVPATMRFSISDIYCRLSTPNWGVGHGNFGESPTANWSVAAIAARRWAPSGDNSSDANPFCAIVGFD